MVEYLLFMPGMWLGKAESYSLVMNRSTAHKTVLSS